MILEYLKIIFKMAIQVTENINKKCLFRIPETSDETFNAMLAWARP